MVNRNNMKFVLPLDIKHNDDSVSKINNSGNTGSIEVY